MSKLTPKERYLRRVAAGQPHFTGLRIAKPLRLRLTEGHRLRRKVRFKNRLMLRMLGFTPTAPRPLDEALTEFSTDPVESQAGAETLVIKETSHETQP